MASLTLSAYAGALRQVLLPYIRDNFPKKTILLDQLKRNTGVTLMNNQFIAPVWTSRHGGVANLATDASSIIQSAGRSVSQGTVSTKIVSGALDISKLAIDATKSDTLAVENSLMAQTKTLASDFARQVNRQYFSDGYGVLSQVRVSGGSVSGTEIAVEAPSAAGVGVTDTRVLDLYGTVNGDISPVKYFAPGQVVAIGSAGTGLGTITAVTGTTIQTTGAVASVGSYPIYIQDGSGLGNGTSEIQGMRLALSSSTGTSTYAGLARNVTGWTPQFGSVSEALTLSRIETSYLKAKEYSENNDKYCLFMNITLYKKYGDILTSMRRTVNSADLLGGWTGLSFEAGAGNAAVYLDYDVPDGEVLIVNLESWTITQVSDINWLEDPNGGGLLRKQNSILYQAVMVWFTNLMCLAPAANGRETQKTS